MSRSRPTPLLCPFCGARLPRPVRLDLASYENSEGGLCVCGAAFAHDQTSHNLGRALLDAYCFAAGSPELALELTAEEDTDEKIVPNYDPQRHEVRPPQPGRYSASALYFVRLRPEAAERLARLREKGGG